MQTVLLADEHVVLVPGVELGAHHVLPEAAVVVAVPAGLGHGVGEAQRSHGRLSVGDAGEAHDSATLVGRHVLADHTTAMVQLDTQVVVLEGLGGRHQTQCNN